MGAGYWDRFTQRRISRRRILQAGATGAAVASAWWLTGCGSSPSRTPVATPGLPPLVRRPHEAGHLEPARPAQSAAAATSSPSPSRSTPSIPHRGVAGSTDFFPRLYNSLVHQSNTRPEFFFNDFAESFENPDEHTWTFTLRPGVRVGPNDLGVPERDLTGDDVVATFDRIKNDARHQQRRLREAVHRDGYGPMAQSSRSRRRDHTRGS